MEAAEMGELMASLSQMEQDPGMLAGFLSMMQSGGGMMQRYKNLDMLRSTEEKDAKFCLRNIRKECAHLNLDSTDGYIVDLGSGCGYLAAQYQHAFPMCTVVASDVTYAAETLKQQEGHPSMILLEHTLKRLLKDHRKKLAQLKKKRKKLGWAGFSKKRKVFGKASKKRRTFGKAGSLRGLRQLLRDQNDQVENAAYVKTYKKMIKNFCEIDVLEPLPWRNVSHLQGKCKLVTCSMMLHQKSFETPEMWKNICLGAADLLMPGGVFFMYDGNCKNQDGRGFEDLSDKSAMSTFAAKCGLTLKTHRVIERGVVFLIVMDKIAEEESPRSTANRKTVLAKGDLVEVHSLVSKKEHNGCTGILHNFNTEKERWAVKVNAGVMAKRQVLQMLLKPENLRQLMPDIEVDYDVSAQAHDPVGAALSKYGPVVFQQHNSFPESNGSQPFEFPPGSASQAPGEQHESFKSMAQSPGDASSPLTCKGLFSPSLSETSTVDTPFRTDSAHSELQAPSDCKQS